MKELTKTGQLAAATLRDPRWQRVLARDAEADGQFWFSVKTTGVYCRPSCGARPPRPENVAFHATQEDALLAGFRPCKRCRPEQDSLGGRHAALAIQACRIIETAETPPSLEQLAEALELSPSHLHRVFRAVTGLTPRKYALAHQARRVREQLDGQGSVTDAIFEAGYGSSSRFYERADSVLGMTPTNFRQGGANHDIRFAIGQCSLGAILVAQSERGVCAIFLGDDPQTLVRDLQDRFPRANLIGGDRAFEELVAKVVGFVEAPSTGLDLPLDVRGTAFQQRVWQALQQIPPGATVSYTDLAQRIGAPRAVRAVGSACAANPLAVAIPCHRVVRQHGGLSGYRWGVERKQALLDREAQA